MVNVSKARAFWAARLRGASSDLTDWERSLCEPFDPFVVRLPHSNELILRSAEFAGMTAALEVRERARIIIDDLNGAMRVTSSSDRVEFSGVTEVLADGTTNETLFVETVRSNSRIGQVAVVTTGGTPSAPQPSLVQKWIAAAAADDLVAEMLRHFGNEPSWYDLYKTFEGIRGLSKSLGGFETRPWTPGKAVVDRFAHTANYYRHGLPHPARKVPPSNPMPLDEAKELIRHMVASIMREVAP